MDNQTATLAIALQLHDLDQLEQSGDLEKAVIDIQRQQLEIDSGFDNVAFEASRRLALSMAKAIEDDSAILAETTRLPQLDDATFHRLAPVNQLPRPAIHSTDHPSNSSQANPSQQNEAFEYQQQRRQQDVIVIHDSVGNACKRKHEDNEEVTTSKKARSVPPGTLLLQHTHVAAEKGERSTAPVSSDLLAKELLPTNLASSLANDDTSSAKADCASCCDSQDINRLVKASCDHHYCRDCFEKFVEASLQTTDGFPPSCCKIPIAFNVVANNVSIPLFHRYRSRQEEIQNATALYCSILGCGVRIESDNISVTTYRAACKACYRDTCTKCRGEVPIKHEDRHICKKDPGREAVLALAKQEGWQACYKCGTMVSLNFGCHHMTCRCKAEFCYKCGELWKTCCCGDYDEPRITDRATRAMGIRAARRVTQGLLPDPRPREQQLADLRQRLQVDCDHNSFSWRHHTRERPGRCDICEYEGWKYILPCENCTFTSCRHCHNYHGWEGGEPFGYDFDFFDLLHQIGEQSEESDGASDEE